mmetsp:Transcript_13857/g.19090  ORF Transcript_13857/g.19090 Transcript_13857/m.19090 type:complete len:103 (+) Transcript_13857:504-812(+)
MMWLMKMNSSSFYRMNVKISMLVECYLLREILERLILLQALSLRNQKIDSPLRMPFHAFPLEPAFSLNWPSPKDKLFHESKIFWFFCCVICVHIFHPLLTHF